VGSGIEIGALNLPLELPRSARVRYVDRLTAPELRKQYPELKAYKLVNVEIIDDGETLAAIGDASQDFVIANHFLEHCENPVKAMTNFVRVLREGGTLFLSIPDKRYTFDRKRELTSFSHLVQDFTEGPALSRSEHLRDWVTNVENQLSEENIQRRIKELESANYSIHFHVWT
jgi:predicted SAM-dependent methyltransferase